MPHEIERKFLVANDGWRRGADRGRRLRQAYIASSDKLSVRVRIEDAELAMLTIKGGRAGLTRLEFEYPVPVGDAETLASLRQGSVIEKTRYDVIHAGRTWEIDVFAGDNEGLVIAEIELDSEDEAFEMPPWAGREVSHEVRYYSARLARHPYRSWPFDGAGGEPE